MDFHPVSRLSELTAGAYGIPEPSAHSPSLTAEETANALCVVPALSVAPSGYRLGYGGGYYDRFLRNFTGRTVCPVYRCMLTEELPFDRYDQRVDLIITEEGGIRTNGKKTEN